MHRAHRLIALILLCLTACQTALPPASSTALPSPFASATFTLLPSTATPTVTISPTASVTASPLPPSLTPTATTPPITTLLFTGIIVPSRCVQAALDANGNPDYPYEEVKDIITSADLAVGTFNSVMSDQVEHTGCVWTYQLVGSPDNADAMRRAGFDLMSVATNHIKDCGLMKGWCDTTFFDTLDNLKRVGILYAGAGKNLAEALQPVVVTINGVKFGFVSLGDSKMDDSVFASEEHPGIAYLDEANARIALAAARAATDVVIALPHWGSEDNLLPNWNQKMQAQMLAANGADLVVGNHTHVPQAYQTIAGVQVFYGLGNFVFDQWLADHRQGIILLVRFQGTRYLGYEMIPTHVDQDGRVHIAGAEEAAEILQRVDGASATLP
jgi:poly-gamma-glutamate capsule biosynthesis protein CapA/YwtB (metallophosphatase superfamily)